MVAGATCRMATGGGRRRLTGNLRSRGRGGGRRCPGGSPAHPRCVGVLGGGGGGLQRRQSLRRSSVGGGEDEEECDDPERPGSIAWARRKKGKRPSFCPSSICSGRSLSTAASGGVSFSSRPLRRLGLGFAAGGKKEGKREQRVVGVLLILHEGQGARGCVGDEGEGSVATAMASLQGEDDGIFAGNPLAAFSFSVFFI